MTVTTLVATPMILLLSLDEAREHQRGVFFDTHKVVEHPEVGIPMGIFWALLMVVVLTNIYYRGFIYIVKGGRT
jgi:hypothetical protein